MDLDSLHSKILLVLTEYVLIDMINDVDGLPVLYTSHRTRGCVIVWEEATTLVILLLECRLVRVDISCDFFIKKKLKKRFFV